MSRSRYYIRITTTTSKLAFRINANDPASAMTQALRQAKQRGYLVQSVCLDGDTIPLSKRERKKALKEKQSQYADFKSRTI